MNTHDHPGTDRLRKVRQSIPGARYFITVCTDGRKPGLETEVLRLKIVEALRELHLCGDLLLHCATIMPDHVHTVFTLGKSLTLSQTQGKFKSRTNDTLEANDLVWQENYYDHRIRQEAFVEPFARYTFLNP